MENLTEEQVEANFFTILTQVCAEYGVSFQINEQTRFITIECSPEVELQIAVKLEELLGDYVVSC